MTCRRCGTDHPELDLIRRVMNGHSTPVNDETIWLQAMEQEEQCRKLSRDPREYKT